MAIIIKSWKEVQLLNKEMGKLLKHVKFIKELVYKDKVYPYCNVAYNTFTFYSFNLSFLSF